MPASPVERATRAGAASQVLAQSRDAQMRVLLAAAKRRTAGIGGTTFTIVLDGVEVFVKRLALTDLERTSGQLHPTTNVFGLPAYFHYGVGSVGAGAWRELAAHQAASDWVVDGLCDQFPLLLHWRSSTRSPPLLATLLRNELCAQAWTSGTGVQPCRNDSSPCPGRLLASTCS